MNENKLLIFIDAVFLALYAIIIAFLYYLGRLPNTLSWMDLTLLGLATARLSDIISTDQVMQWLRKPFVKMETTQIADREVETREGAGSGFRKIIGDLLACPWCVSVWVAAGLSFAYFIIPAIVWPLILILAVSEIGAILQTISTILVRLEKYLKGLGVPEEGV